LPSVFLFLAGSYVIYGSKNANFRSKIYASNKKNYFWPNFCLKFFKKRVLKTPQNFLKFNFFAIDFFNLINFLPGSQMCYRHVSYVHRNICMSSFEKKIIGTQNCLTFLKKSIKWRSILRPDEVSHLWGNFVIFVSNFLYGPRGSKSK